MSEQPLFSPTPKPGHKPLTYAGLCDTLRKETQAVTDARTRDALRAFATRTAEDAQWAANMLAAIDAAAAKLGATHPAVAFAETFRSPLSEIAGKGRKALADHADAVRDIRADIARGN